jgi:1,5-anhydro-D-fructose reductase (1,5-anhydro-D-mannitol-forming)
MQRPIRVAAVGFWHVHAEDYAEAAELSPDVELVALWDDSPDRLLEHSTRFKAEPQADLDQLLAREDIDGITVTTATSAHYDVISRAIKAGKHVFSEKLLAPTLIETQSLVDLASAHDVALEVSLPRLYQGYTRAISGVLNRGQLGRLTYSRIRLAHGGWVSGWLPEQFGNAAESIGGALTDLGCHPAYLTNLFHDATPESVSAVYSYVSGREVEDNASVCVKYADGSLGVLEASFVDVPGSFTIELVGTSGALRYGFAGSQLQGSGDAFGSDEWVGLPLEPDDKTPFDRWIDAIRTGVPDAANLAASIDLTRLVEASNKSAKLSQSVKF